MNYRNECMKEHRELAKNLHDESLKYQLSDTEKIKINNLRKDRNNSNIFLSIQNTDIAIEEINDQKIVIHDLKKNKFYISKWYQEIGMPIITVFVPYIDVLYYSSLIK